MSEELSPIQRCARRWTKGGPSKAAIRLFILEVNHRAELNMEKTGKLEGSHYAAMQAVAKELGL